MMDYKKKYDELFKKNHFIQISRRIFFKSYNYL